MAKDFKAKQLRTTQIIASGSSVGSVPSLLIYSASDATDVDGSYTAAMTSNVGIDVWMFVSGAKNDTGLANDNHSGKVLFAGDVVVSGTLYAEKQIMEVDLSQNSDLFLSGAVILGDQGAAPDGNGQLRLYQSIGANSGSIFVSTGSIYLGANSGGSYSETEITPKIYQADNGIAAQVISSTNTSLHLDINELTGSLTDSTIAAGDLFAVADIDATNNEVKKISLTNVAAKLAGDGITATTGVLAATARNGINVSSNGIELSLTDVSGSSSIATGDSMVFLDTDGSTQITTVAQLVTALAGDGLSNSGNQFQVGVDDSTIERNSDQLRVKDDGITAAKINSDVAGTGLEQHTDGSIRIATAAAGNGLSGGGGSALSVNTGNGLKISSDSVITDDAVVAHLSGSEFNGHVGITGSLAVTSGDLSLTANSRLRLNNPGENDQYIYGNNSNIIMETDKYLNVYADTSVNFDVNNGSSRNFVQFTYNSTNFNTQRNPTNFRVDTDTYYGTFFIDGTDETIIIGNENFDSTPLASEVAGYGDDVKIMLSGSAGSKDDGSKRGVVLVPGDMVVSGTLYDGDGSRINLLSYSENGTFTTPSNATGTNSVAIGNKAVASGNNSIALGTSETNTTEATGLHAAALGGDDATASGDYSTVLGGYGNTASGDYSAVLGRASTAAGIDSVAIGKSLTATEDNSIAIGNRDNNAKIALSGSVEVFSTAVLNGDTTVSEGSDLLVSGYVKHLSDTDTSIQFDNDRVRFNAGGSTYIDLNTDQVSLHSSDASANTDVNFFVSGSIGSKDGAEKGTSLFGGDVHISGSLHGIDELVFDSTDTKIYRDGAVLKFDDASNDVKTLSQLASTGASTDHFVGVHGSSPATSKLKTTASISFAGALDNFVDGLAAEGVGIDTFVFFSGSIGSKDGTERGVTLFGGDSVFSGSATYLGTTNFSSLTVTGDITAGGSFVADGNLIKNSNGDKVLKFSSSTSATLIADSSVIDSTTPSAFLHIENAENVQAATTNETSNFNILLRNSSTQTNAFAGIAFDVSTELDADSIGAAIRGERDTAASTNATLHDTNLTFSTNDAGDSGLTERMRITHDGKVGIGITDPLESLHISGDLRIDGDDIKDSGGNIAISFNGSGNIDNNISFSANPQFTGNVDFADRLRHIGDTTTQIRFVGANQISMETSAGGLLLIDGNSIQKEIVFNDVGADIDFRVETDTNTHTIFARGSDNNVGIRNSNPLYPLDVTGDIQLSGDLRLGGNDIIGTALNLDSSGDITLDADGGQIYFRDGGVNYMQFNVNGTTDSIAVTGGLTIDATTNITLDADGGTITFADNGVSLGTITSAGYSGTAANATNVAVTNDTVTNATHYVAFVGSTSGNQAINVDSGGMTYNPSTNTLTVTNLNATDLTGMQSGAITVLKSLTSTELDSIDGDTAATTTTVASADRVVYNDNGTMKQVSIADLMKKVSPFSTVFYGYHQLDNTSGVLNGTRSRFVLGNADSPSGDSSTSFQGAGYTSMSTVDNDATGTDHFMPNSAVDAADDLGNVVFVCDKDLTVTGFKLMWIGEYVPRLRWSTAMQDSDIIIYLGKQDAANDFDDSGTKYNLITSYSTTVSVGSDCATVTPFKVLSIDFDSTVDFSAGDKMSLYIRYYVNTANNIAIHYDQDGSIVYIGSASAVYFKPRIIVNGYYR